MSQTEDMAKLMPYRVIAIGRRVVLFPGSKQIIVEVDVRVGGSVGRLVAKTCKRTAPLIVAPLQILLL